MSNPKQTPDLSHQLNTFTAYAHEGFGPVTSICFLHHTHFTIFYIKYFEVDRYLDIDTIYATLLLYSITVTDKAAFLQGYCSNICIEPF